MMSVRVFATGDSANADLMNWALGMRELRHVGPLPAVEHRQADLSPVRRGVLLPHERYAPRLTLIANRTHPRVIHRARSIPRLGTGDHPVDAAFVSAEARRVPMPNNLGGTLVGHELRVRLVQPVQIECAE